MNTIQLMLVAGGVLALLVLGYAIIAGPNVGKNGQRRLQQLRYRHSESTDTKVESQLKKAIAARKPKAHKTAGSDSRIEALALRLDRTGKGWTLSQYAYASLGIGLVVALIMFLRSGSLPLSLAIGTFAGAGIPHFIVGRAIKKRTNQFNAKFPDAIELLVRGLRSGLPVTETLAVVAQEVPGPVGAEFPVGRTGDVIRKVAGQVGEVPRFSVMQVVVPENAAGNDMERFRKLRQFHFKLQAGCERRTIMELIVPAWDSLNNG